MPTETSRRRPGARMPLLGHLLELRRRLVIAALAILVGAIVGWFLSANVLDAMRAPITALAREQHRLADLNYDGVTAAFDLRFRIALGLGVVVSSPVWLYQIWAFFVPAMTRRELKYAFGFFFSAVPLFLAGCVAGWTVVPHMVQLLAGFAPSGDTTFIQASGYFDFVLKLVLAVGIAFVVPAFLVLLNFAGVLPASAIRRGWRVAMLAITLFTALVTPSADVISMFLLAVPMVLLYLAAAAIAWVHDRRVAEVRSRMLVDDDWDAELAGPEDGDLVAAAPSSPEAAKEPFHV